MMSLCNLLFVKFNYVAYAGIYDYDQFDMLFPPLQNLIKYMYNWAMKMAPFSSIQIFFTNCVFMVILEHVFADRTFIAIS